jgi:hypothetical protein
MTEEMAKLIERAKPQELDAVFTLKCDTEQTLTLEVRSDADASGQ